MSWTVLDPFAAIDTLVAAGSFHISALIGNGFDIEWPLPTWWVWDQFVHGTVALALNVALLTGVLRLAYTVASRIWPSFRECPRDDNQRWYLLVNLSKAACLALMCLSKQWLSDSLNSFIDNQWDTISDATALRAKRIVAFYVATDVVALAVVPQLPHTTIVHHYVTILLALSIFGTDLRRANVARMALLYGALCTTTYLVNALLALRCLYDKRWWTSWLSAAALVIYAVACAINWLWHAVWFAQQMSHGFYHIYRSPSATALDLVNPASVFASASILAYAYSVAMLVRDDLILMAWLWRRMQRSASLRLVTQYLALAHDTIYAGARFLAEPHRRIYERRRKS